MTFIQDALYQLKQMSVCLPIDVYNAGLEVYDLSTGQMYGFREKYTVKALVLPSNITQLKHLAGTIGRTSGEIDVDTKSFIISLRDLAARNIDKKDYIVYASRKYEIVQLEKAEELESVLIITKHVPSSWPSQSIEATVSIVATQTSEFTVIP